MVRRMPLQRILCTNPIEPSQFFGLQMARRYRYLLFIRTVFIILMGVLSMHSRPGCIWCWLGSAFFSRIRKRRLLTVSKKIQHIERFPFLGTNDGSRCSLGYGTGQRFIGGGGGETICSCMLSRCWCLFAAFGLSGCGAVFERYGYVVEVWMHLQ